MRRGVPFELVFGEHEAPLKVVFLTLLGLFLRFAWYDVQPLWTDEAITWEFAKATWDGLLFRQLYDASPPGFYALLHAWLDLVRSNAEMRWLPALLGAATIPAAYWLGATVHHRATGVLAALMVAINPLHLYYSNEVRYPALLTLLLTLQVLAFAAVLRRDSWRRWIVWAALTTAALWVQYFTAFFLFAEAAYLLIYRRRDRRVLGRFVASAFAAGLLFVPWWTEFTLQLTRGKPSREFFGLFEQFFLAPAFLFLGGSEWSLPAMAGLDPSRGLFVPAAIIAMSPTLAALWFGARADKQGTPRRVASFVALVALAAFVVTAQFLPLFRPKYLLPLLPLTAVLLGHGLVTLEQRTRAAAWALFAAVLALSLHGVVAWQTDPRLQKEPWDDVAATLDKYAQPGDAVAVPNDYYALALWLAVGDRWPIEAVVCRTPHEQQASERVTRANAERLLARYRRVWYIDHDRHLFDPQERVPGWFAASAHEVTRPTFPVSRHFRVRLFTADEATAHASLAGVVEFARGDHAPNQVGPDLQPGPAGYRWFASSATARVGRRFGEDIAFACFYVHTPFFTDGAPTFTLWAGDTPVRAVRVTASDLICLEGALGPAGRASPSVVLRLTADRTFVPHDVLGDGDITPKSALLREIGVTRASEGWEVP
jgi:4-amino-4-deoxy-L-arabinose transferase-like glycosyltransferase